LLAPPDLLVVVGEIKLSRVFKVPDDLSGLLLYALAANHARLRLEALGVFEVFVVGILLQVLIIPTLLLEVRNNLLLLKYSVLEFAH